MSNRNSYNRYGNIVTFVWVLAAFFVSGLWVYLVLVQQNSFSHNLSPPSYALIASLDKSSSEARSDNLGNKKISDYLTSSPELSQRVLSVNNWNNTFNHSELPATKASVSIDSSGDNFGSAGLPLSYGLYLGEHRDLSSLRSELSKINSLDLSFLSSLSAYYYSSSSGSDAIFNLVLGSLSSIEDANYLCETLLSLSFDCSVEKFISDSS